MKMSKFTEEQIAFALHQADKGVSAEQVCRKVGVSQATFYAWKKKYSNLRTSTKLKQLVADLSLDKVMLLDQPRSQESCLPLRGGRLDSLGLI